MIARSLHHHLLPLLIRRGVIVRGSLYGRDFWMPSEHELMKLLVENPQFNRPLGVVCALLRKPDRPLSVIDVGANIGETVAVIEQMNPGGGCVYLCLEADTELAALCRRNYQDTARVVVKEAAVGEASDLGFVMEDDGRANPSLRPSDVKGRKLTPLDQLAKEFADTNGVDLIKTDTEGYDFAVLRSAKETLRKFQPGVFFEWFPKLMLQYGERPTDVFEYLGELGYRHWVVFTSGGELYCEISDPPHRAVEVLAGVALGGRILPYFDVFASVDETVCRAVTDAYISRKKGTDAVPDKVFRAATASSPV